MEYIRITGCGSALPKKVLTNMIRDIDSSTPRLNVEDVASLEKTVKELARPPEAADPSPQEDLQDAAE